MSKHLVVMAAGTGGHIIPGIAVAQEMRARGWSVSWLGTTHGMENKLVPPSGIAMDTITFSGVRGKGLVHTLTGGFRLLGAFWQCLRILRARGTTAVLGMGGYVCFPGGLMASLLSRPLVLVNADASLLMSNRALLPVADRIAFGFDGADTAKIKQAVVTGNPVRIEIEALPQPAQRFAHRRAVPDHLTEQAELAHVGRERGHHREVGVFQRERRRLVEPQHVAQRQPRLGLPDRLERDAGLLAQVWHELGALLADTGEQRLNGGRRDRGPGS